jgi:hypothetical protein
MHPNTFLRTFWRLEFKPHVFVAMPFGERFQSRFEDVIAPAISGISVDGVELRAHRVDLSKSGDSILTEINDGIAHSRLFLADVSTVGKDADTGQAFRNGNVMYEVGIALACRQPHEVLLIRDDNDRFLFDVSTIAHMTIDFGHAGKARKKLHQALVDRLKEGQFVLDARVQRAIAALTANEIGILKEIAALPSEEKWGRRDKGDVPGIVTIPRLLDKQLVRVAGESEGGIVAYQATPLGYLIAKLVAGGLPKFAHVERKPSLPPAQPPAAPTSPSEELPKSELDDSNKSIGGKEG